MLADSKAYFDANSPSDDIVILSFNNFKNIANPDTDVFNSAFETALGAGTRMKATSAYDIADDNIDNINTLGVNIIPFFDGVSANQYVWDGSGSILTGKEMRNSSEGSDIIAGVLGQLVNAWDSSRANGQINQIYYTLNIDGISALSTKSSLFPSYLEYNADLAVTLPNTINKYPKLYFGNIIIVDFIEASSVVDEVVILNYNYLNCRDDVANWNDAMDCSVATDLPRDYKTSGLSTACDGDTGLQGNCERSCGTCTWLTGAPGSQCSSDADCSSGIYTDVLGGNGVCFTRQADWDTFISEPSFCLAPYHIDNCGTISSDTCSNEGTTTLGCTEFCNADFQCTSGYCNAQSGVCC